MSVSEHPVFVICSNRLSSRLRVLCLSTRSMRSERQDTAMGGNDERADSESAFGGDGRI